MMFSMQTDQRDLAKMSKIEAGIAKAVAYTLMDSANFFRDDLLASLKKDVNKPAPFTLAKSGYKVVFAKFGDANSSVEMNIAPKPCRRMAALRQSRTFPLGRNFTLHRGLVTQPK